MPWTLRNVEGVVVQRLPVFYNYLCRAGLAMLEEADSNRIACFRYFDYRAVNTAENIWTNSSVAKVSEDESLRAENAL